MERTGKSTTEHGKQSLRAGAYRLELLPAGACEAAFTAETAVVGFAFDAQTGHHAIASDRQRPFLRHPNSLAVIPAGCDVRSSSARGGEYLVIIPDNPARLDVPATNLCGSEIFPAALALRKTLLSRGQAEGAEALSEIVVAAAARRHPLGEASRWMTPHRFARVEQLIDDRMSRTVSITDLAAAIGVSPSFFARSFRAFAGTTPQRYMTLKRLQRARFLIQTSGLGLAEIAAECGFSSQSHMSRVFSEHTGAPPSRMDRSRGAQRRNL